MQIWGCLIPFFFFLLKHSSIRELVTLYNLRDSTLQAQHQLPQNLAQFYDLSEALA